MKKRLALMFFVAISLVASHAMPQPSGTALVIRATWDNDTNIQGTVTLAEVNKSGPETVMAIKTLVQGGTSVAETLEPNSVYSVTLREKDGKELLGFPFTTALINPSSLKGGEIDLIFHSADHSLAAARITVNLTF